MPQAAPTVSHRNPRPLGANQALDHAQVDELARALQLGDVDGALSAIGLRSPTMRKPARSDEKLISLCDRVVAHEKVLDKYATDERDNDAIPEVVRSERG